MSDIEADRSDEISIRDIAVRVWRSRGLIVVLVVLAVLAGGAYVAATALMAERPVTYVVSLRSIDNAQYPNGTAFSPQDLLIPEVLIEVRKRFKIDGPGDLRQAISVNYDSPLAAGLSKSYGDRLAARNLTQAEISAINDEYQRALTAATRSSLRINVDYQSLGVSSETGLAIARALPEIWSSVYTTQFRIFVDTRLANLAVAQVEEDLKSTGSVLSASSRLASMKSGLQYLSDDNRLSLLRAADGTSATDLREQINRYEVLYFNPIRVAVLDSQDAVAQAYLANLRLMIDDLNRRIAAYDATLVDLREYQSASRGPLDPSAVGQISAPSTDRSGLQLGDSGIASVVDLAERASLASFVQEVLRERYGLQSEVSNRIRELALMTGSDAPTRAMIDAPTAAEGLKTLTASYSTLVAAAEAQLQNRSIVLYEPMLGPMLEGSLINMRNLLIVALAGLGALLLGLVIAVLRPVKRVAV